MKQRILIVDDEMGICTSLTFALEDQFEVQSTTSPAEALGMLRADRFSLCLLDLKIGKHSGIDLLTEVKTIAPETVVIIMTAYGSIESSVEAIRKGAYTYLTKPLDLNDLQLTIEQALDYQRLNAKVEYLSSQLSEKFFYNGLIGKSRPMLHVFSMVEKLKNVDTSVLITGESGTGKELVAKALHFAGSRGRERLAEVNCAAIPEGLLEAELFGHRRGAFTGAVSDQAGKLEYANNGTLFLDEIGDMPLPLQAKILRVLQERVYTQIGSNEPRRLNLRVVSATNQDLRAMVERGVFRKDLYFRLNVVEIALPPLRERKEDLPLLIERFIRSNNESLHKNITGLSKEAERKLYTYHFPGNVRELINIIEYAMVLCEGNTVELRDLPISVREYEEIPACARDGLFLEDLTGMSLKQVEKRVIEAALRKNKGHRLATARMLDISEKGLRNKIAEYGIKV